MGAGNLALTGNNPQTVQLITYHSTDYYIHTYAFPKSNNSGHEKGSIRQHIA
jgi:hypothetical protein